MYAHDHISKGKENRHQIDWASIATLMITESEAYSRIKQKVSYFNK